MKNLHGFAPAASRSARRSPCEPITPPHRGGRPIASPDARVAERARKCAFRGVPRNPFAMHRRDCICPVGGSPRWSLPDRARIPQGSVDPPQTAYAAAGCARADGSIEQTREWSSKSAAKATLFRSVASVCQEPFGQSHYLAPLSCRRKRHNRHTNPATRVAGSSLRILTHDKTHTDRRARIASECRDVGQGTRHPCRI
jgi:hypothetical protein